MRWRFVKRSVTTYLNNIRHVPTNDLIKQIATWYRWQTNPARLGRTSGVKGVLKFDAVLSGGVELKGTRAPQKVDIYSHKYYEAKVKGMADTEIQRENVTNRGPKLNKRREVTRRMFLEESEEVKEKIERKYRKARSRYMKARQRQKSGKLSKIDEAAKIKYVLSYLIDIHCSI